MFSKLKFSFLVLVFVHFNLIWYCQCMNIIIATTPLTPTASAFQSRKLSNDDVELVTRDTNSIAGPKDLLKHEKLKEPNFPQFTEPPAPVYITNHPPVRHSLPLNLPIRHYPPINETQYQQMQMHQQIQQQQQQLQQQQYQQQQLMMTTPFVPPNYSLSERHNFMEMMNYYPKSPQSFQELMNMPLNMANLRGIKSSIMTIVYKVQNFMNYVLSFFSPDNSLVFEGRGNKYGMSKKFKKIKKFKIKKKFKKFLLPLLLAYKLKFFALIPILIGGLILLVGSTGMAGFFFALFTAVISLKEKH